MVYRVGRLFHLKIARTRFKPAEGCVTDQAVMVTWSTHYIFYYFFIFLCPHIVSCRFMLIFCLRALEIIRSRGDLPTQHACRMSFSAWLLGGQWPAVAVGGRVPESKNSPLGPSHVITCGTGCGIMSLPPVGKGALCHSSSVRGPTG